MVDLRFGQPNCIVSTFESTFDRYFHRLHQGLAATAGCYRCGSFEYYVEQLVHIFSNVLSFVPQSSLEQTCFKYVNVAFRVRLFHRNPCALSTFIQIHVSCVPNGEGNKYCDVTSFKWKIHSTFYTFTIFFTRSKFNKPIQFRFNHRISHGREVIIFLRFRNKQVSQYERDSIAL